MKLEVGMYCRYNNFQNKIKIAKIKGIQKADEVFQYDYINFDNDDGELETNIIKASYDIIDLIKSKDIILGRDGKIYQCWKIYKDYVFTYSKNKQGQTITLVDYQIDKVLTKEQIEQMAYKVGIK